MKNYIALFAVSIENLKNLLFVVNARIKMRKIIEEESIDSLRTLGLIGNI